MHAAARPAPRLSRPLYRGSRAGPPPVEWSRVSSTRSCSASGCTRHSGAGVRATASTISCRSVTPTAQRRARSRCTLRKARNAARDLRRRVRELHAEAGDLHRPRDRAPTASSTRTLGSRKASGPRRRGRLGGPCDPRSRDDRAAQEPRAPGRGLAFARRGKRSSWRRARAGATGQTSPSPGSGGSVTPRTPTWARLYRGAAVLVYPVLYEGFGMPIVRGDGLRHAGRGLAAPDARRGLRRRRCTRRPARRRRRSRQESGRPSSRRADLVPPGAWSTPRGSPGSATGATMLRALEARPSSPGFRLVSAAARCQVPTRDGDRRPDEVAVVVRRAGCARGLEYLVLLRSPEKLGYWHLVAGGVEWGEDACRGRRTGARRGNRAGRPACRARRPTGSMSSPVTPSPCASASPKGRNASPCGPSSPTPRRGGSRCSTRSTSTIAGSTPTARSRCSTTRSRGEALRRAAS